VTRNTQPHRIVAGALALLVALAFSAPPAGAAEPRPEPSPSPEPSTLAGSVDAALEAMPSATLAAAAQTTQEPPSGPDNPSFFKTGKGVAVLALLAGGLGYTIYSFSHDRVKSPNHE